MIVSAAELDKAQTYRLLSGLVVPRPIAFVTTLSADGTLNQVNILCNAIPNNDGFAIQVFTNDPTGWSNGGAGLTGSDPNSTYNADTLIFNEDPIPTSRFNTQAVPLPDSANCRVTLIPGLALTALESLRLRN